MGKHVTCPDCGKEHYASFEACPFCEAASLAQTGESDSLAAGSGSHKYGQPGTTDWTDYGGPDWLKRPNE